LNKISLFRKKGPGNLPKRYNRIMCHCFRGQVMNHLKYLKDIEEFGPEMNYVVLFTWGRDLVEIILQGPPICKLQNDIVGTAMNIVTIKSNEMWTSYSVDIPKGFNLGLIVLLSTR
jgi:hypothetical protein